MSAAVEAVAAEEPSPDRQLTESIAVGVLAMLVLLGFSRFDSSVYNNYVYLADAFLHHRVWIDWPGPRIDALSFGGRYYIIEGPVPALMLLPFVAAFGMKTNQTAFACVMAGAALGAAWHLARRLGAGRDAASFLTVFLALGTCLAWCAIYGAVWFVAHVCAFAFTTFALVEAVGKRRPWVLTGLLVLAAGSRFSLSLAIVPMVLYALSYLPRKQWPKELAWCAAVLAPAIAFFVWYNYARWGVPNDIGYTAWYHADQIGEPTGSPFRLSYVPYEMLSFFGVFPEPIDHFPWVRLATNFPRWLGRYPWFDPGYSAVPLTLTTPALVLAFFARTQRRLVIAMWATALILFVPNVTYYANGGSQWGMRHALDFEPFLFVPITLTFVERRVPGWISDTLCGFSALVGVWGIWYWRTFFDSMLVHVLPPGQ